MFIMLYCISLKLYNVHKIFCNFENVNDKWGQECIQNQILDMNLSLWFLNNCCFIYHLTELWGSLRIYRVFARSQGRTTANNNEVCHQSDTITNQ